jgi:hypothetical protein
MFGDVLASGLAYPGPEEEVIQVQRIWFDIFLASPVYRQKVDFTSSGF